jgi:hypothetical protein
MHEYSFQLLKTQVPWHENDQKALFIKNLVIFRETRFWEFYSKKKTLEKAKKKALKAYEKLTGPKRKSLAATYSSILLRIVPSAKKSLTAEFGMGSGVSSSL